MDLRELNSQYNITLHSVGTTVNSSVSCNILLNMTREDRLMCSVDQQEIVKGNSYNIQVWSEALQAPTSFSIIFCAFPPTLKNHPIPKVNFIGLFISFLYVCC